jgi:histidine triad (HIT) family protein
MECIFCKIVEREVPATIIYEDDEIIAFDDLHPKAPYHKLIIPKKHIATLNDLTPEDATLFGKMALVAQKLAKEYHIDQTGYRIVVNCNRDGGQIIYHIHLHLLGGRPLTGLA